ETNERYICTVNGFGQCKLWNIETSEFVRAFTANSSFVEWHLSRHLLISYSSNDGFSVFEPQSGAQLASVSLDELASKAGLSSAATQLYNVWCDSTDTVFAAVRLQEDLRIL